MNDLIFVGLTEEEIVDLIKLLELSDNECYEKIKEKLIHWKDYL